MTNNKVRFLLIFLPLLPKEQVSKEHVFPEAICPSFSASQAPTVLVMTSRRGDTDEVMIVNDHLRSCPQ